jgi:asparagine synthase (glutamine-hydrolysing)
MCGICGKMIFGDIIPEKELIKKMCDTIRYRGPDDEGIHTEPHIGLGQRRLSIIDLDSQACPPLSNEDNSIWIVFNGEIYNFMSLRTQLQSLGHHFKTKTDTEVIIHLYEESGYACLEQLQGMFAFALWDKKKQILFCARDRFGKKPFCYTQTAKAFIFGSEIKAITADKDISIAPNMHAIDLYLSYQYVPSPFTAFQNIKKLRAGEYLTCDIHGNTIIKSYWQPKNMTPSTESKDSIKGEIISRLRKSVKKRMISDVPLGAFLSGGIDSGTIVALMAQESSRPVKTFSIGFEEESHNELPYARMVAKRYNTDHHEMIVKPNATEILPILVKHYNEPFADSSAIPTYYVSKMAREHVTVALSGDGGDESFAGYKAYTYLKNVEKWNTIPLSIRTMMAKSGKNIIDLFPYNNKTSRIRRGLSMIESKNIKELHLKSAMIIKQEEKSILYTKRMNEMVFQNKCENPLERFPWNYGVSSIDWLMMHDQINYLPDCLMVKTDIVSMANSLEVRSPFLDHHFNQYVATIPVMYKHNGESGKVILKNAVRDLLPDAILNKPKTGFSIPLSKWFRGELVPLLRDTLLDEKFKKRGIFQYEVVSRMVNEHISSQRDWSNRLWALLFLELWFREFID